MKILELHPLDAVDHLVWPDDHIELTLESPARSVFTDFHRSEPLVINADMAASEAARLLGQSHTGMHLVLDGHGDFVGLVGRAELSERNRILRVAGGESLDALTVRDQMIPRHRIRAMDLEALEDARVADVVETLRFHGDRHCLVVRQSDHHICGIIAASDIARRLHMRIDVDGPPTFAQIYSALRDH